MRELNGKNIFLIKRTNRLHSFSLEVTIIMEQQRVADKERTWPHVTKLQSCSSKGKAESSLPPSQAARYSLVLVSCSSS